MVGRAATLVLLGCGVALGSAQAGTRGGLYDFGAMLSQPHPFAAAPAVAAAPSAPRAAATGRQEPQPGLFDGGDLWRRWYLRAGGGLDLPDDLDTEARGRSVSIDVDDGFLVEAAIGRYIGRGFRAELELSHRRADLTSARRGGAQASVGGDYTVTATMLNGFYDLNFDFPIVPYVGAGIGAAQIEYDGFTVGGVRVGGESSTEFAYQGIVGLSWRFLDSVTATVDYRYFGTAGDNDTATMSVVAGIRYDL